MATGRRRRRSGPNNFEVGVSFGGVKKPRRYSQKNGFFFEMLRRRLANCFGAIPRPCPGILPISLFFLFLSLGLVTGGGNCGGFFVRGRRRKRKKEKDRRGGRPVRKNRDRIILGRGIIGSVPALSSRP